jgi:hypothetical protein
MTEDRHSTSRQIAATPATIFALPTDLERLAVERSASDRSGP